MAVINAVHINSLLYIKNLKYLHLTPVFRQQNLKINLLLPIPFQIVIIYRKPGFKREYKYL